MRSVVAFLLLFGLNAAFDAQAASLFFGQGTEARIDVIDPVSGAAVRSLTTTLGADSIGFTPVPLPPTWILFSSSSMLML